MLVLSRGIDEGIMIGDNICVTIVRINGGAVRIGIEAPRETPVVRAEFLLNAEPVDGLADKKPAKGPQ